MRKLVLSCLLFIISFSCVRAQLYKYGIGARVGKFNSGITFKGFFNTQEGNGFEVQLLKSNIANIDGYVAKGFFIKQIEFKVPFIQLPLDWVMGAGIDIGYFPFEDNGYYKIVDGNPVYYNKSIFAAGLDATFQLEYQLRRVAPFTIGVDATPFYDVVNKGPEWIDIGVNIRYVVR